MEAALEGVRETGKETFVALMKDAKSLDRGRASGESTVKGSDLRGILKRERGWEGGARVSVDRKSVV